MGMKTEKLLVFQKVYDFCLWMMPHTEKFPKIQRFALAQEINKSLIKLLTEIVSINLKKDKVKDIKDLNIFVDKLRIMIRLSKDLHFISIKRYKYASEKLEEIGRLLGGWIKQQKGGRS